MFKMEVIADNSGTWAGNAMKYNTPEEAEQAAKDLMCRWLLVRYWRVVNIETEEVVKKMEGAPD